MKTLFRTSLQALRPALFLLIVFTVVTGIAYPLLVTGVAQVCFPSQANGSLVRAGDRIVGSSLLGQEFTEPRYFWGRLSATGGSPYNAMASGGSNEGAMHPALVEAATARIAALRAADSMVGATTSIPMPLPAELVTASGSGLDPDISVAAAEFQAGRIARARGIPAERVRDLIRSKSRPPFLGFSGMPRVNVLELNLALDRP